MALPDGRIVIGLMQQGISSEIQDDEDRAIARLIVLMDGTKTIDQICATFAETHPDFDDQSVREVIAGLIDNGFVEDAGAPLPGNLTPREAARYRPAKNFFAWIDSTPRSSPYDIQSKIKDAKVCLLGIGGTGSAVAAGLVSSGIGASCTSPTSTQSRNRTSRASSCTPNRTSTAQRSTAPWIGYVP